MPASERHGGGAAEQSGGVIEALEEEAYRQFVWEDPDDDHLPESMRETRPERSARYGLLFSGIIEEWAAWKQGIPPSSEWLGLNAQNPRLLWAFAALERAEGRAERDRLRAARKRG